MARHLKSPFPWLGGKKNFVSTLLNFMPPHTHYVEVFGGSAALLLAKKPVQVETYNDLDSGLVNFFRVCRDAKKAKKLTRLVELTPYSRQEYYAAVKTWEKEKSDIVRAYKWYLVAAMSFGGMFGKSWGYATSVGTRGMAQTTSKWLRSLDLMPKVQKRLTRVQIEQNDWRKILDAYVGEHYLAYLDPPYVPETRKGGVYENELTQEDHAELVERLLAYPAMVMLSGYDHPVYDPLRKAGWSVLKFKRACMVVGRTRAGLKGQTLGEEHQRVEVLWRNPKAVSMKRLMDKVLRDTN